MSMYFNFPSSFCALNFILFSCEMRDLLIELRVFEAEETPETDCFRARIKSDYEGETLYGTHMKMMTICVLVMDRISTCATHLFDMRAQFRNL